MWKKSKLVLLSSTLAFTVTCNATNHVVFATGETKPQATELEAPNPETKTPVNQNYLKVKFENKILFHEQVPTKTIIQVLDASKEVLESEVLSGDMELELDSPKVSKGKMLSYWSIERKDDKLLITPILTKEKELPVKFLSTEGGQLLQNNAQTKEIVKSVNKGTNLKDILPEVNPKENYKFAGWFKSNEKIDVDDVKVIDSKGEYYAKFYPDFNNNNINDRTEEITIKFVTNSDQKFKDIKTHVGKQIKLPTLKKKDSVFMGWYTDQEYKNKFTDGTLTESQTFYAKWKKAETVIKEAQGKPITDKNISDQIEQILKEKLQGYNNSNASSNSTKAPNSNANSSGNNVQAPNSNAAKAPSSDSAKAPNNNAAQAPNSNVPASNPPIVINGSGYGAEPSKPNYEGNTGTTFKEKTYVFANENIGEMFMVKFFEKDGGFLSSMTLPYGKTIKLYDENEKLHGEYAIRQDTSITLDTKDYVNKGSVFVGFDSREVSVNSAQITELFPKVQVDSAVSKTLAEQQEMAAAEAEQAAKKKKILLFSLISLGIGAIAGGAYLFIRRKRLAKENVEEETI